MPTSSIAAIQRSTVGAIVGSAAGHWFGPRSRFHGVVRTLFGSGLLWSEIELVTPVGTSVGDLVAEDRGRGRRGSARWRGASVGLRQIEEVPCRSEHRLVEVGIDAVAAEIDETDLVGCSAQFLDDGESFGAGRIVAERGEVDDRQRIHGPILWFWIHPR